MVIKEDQLQWYSSFDKKYLGAGIKSMPNQQFANKLHKPIIRKIERQRV